MLQTIITLVSSFAITLLRLVTTNPKTAASEASIIHTIANDVTNADMIATPGGTWTYTPPPASTSAS